MKYTRKRNRKRIIRGGQNSPKGKRPSCLELITLPCNMGEAACVACLDECTKGESRSTHCHSCTRRHGKSSFPRGVTHANRIKGRGTKRKRKKRKKKNN